MQARKLRKKLPATRVSQRNTSLDRAAGAVAAPTCTMHILGSFAERNETSEMRRGKGGGRQERRYGRELEPSEGWKLEKRALCGALIDYCAEHT